MANYAEKKSILMASSKEKTYWYIILAVTGAYFAYGLFRLIQAVSKSGSSITGAGVVPGSFVVGALVLAVALQVFYFYGVWRLERWVTLFMWLGFIFSVLGFDILSAIITGLILFGYKKILKVVYPKSLAAQAKQVN